jgi:hypothetical protein
MDWKGVKGHGFAEDENSEFRDEMEDGHLVCFDHSLKFELMISEAKKKENTRNKSNILFLLF